MKSIKKLAAVLIAFVFAAACPFAFAEEETPQPVSEYTQKAEDIMNGMIDELYGDSDSSFDTYAGIFVLDNKLVSAQWGTTAYVMESDTWQKTDVSMPEDFFEYTCSQYYTLPDGKTAYGIRQVYDNETGEPKGYMICKFAFAEDGTLVFTPGEIMQMDFDASASDIVSFCGDEKTSYMLVNEYMSNSTLLYSIDVDSQTPTKITTSQGSLLQSVTYTNGKLYGYCLDSARVFSDNEGKILPYMITINTETGAEEDKKVLPKASVLMGLTSCDGNLYYRDVGGIYMVDGNMTHAEKVAYAMASGSSSNSCPVVWNGKFCSPGQSITMISINPDDMQKTVITVSGDCYNLTDLIASYTKLHPDVAIVSNGQYYWNADSFRTEMQSDSPCDLFVVSMSSTAFNALKSKGFLMDMSENETISGTVSAMYPQIASGAFDGSKIVALPISLETTSWGYYPSAFQKVGLTEDDVPKTLMDMLNFIEKFVREIQPEHPEMQLFQYLPLVNMMILQSAISQSVMSSRVQGTTVAIDTPQMREIMEKIDSMKPVWDELSRLSESSDGAVIGAIYYYGEETQSDVFFDTYCNILPGDRYRGTIEEKPLLLSLDENSPAYFSINPQCVILNPYSKNKDAVLDFAAYVAENMSHGTKVRLLSNFDEPLISTGYETQIKGYTKALAQYEEGIDSVPDEDKPTWQMYIDSINSNLEYLEKNKWNISPEEIEEYHTLVTQMVVSDEYISSEDISKLVQRYIDGQIPGTQFIKEYSRIMQMMAMENQ